MTERLLTVQEVADMIGMTRMGVFGLVFKKRIPCIKLSKRCLRFRRSDIEAWLESKTQQALQVQAQTTPARRSPGRPRKGSKGIADGYVGKLIESAKKEILK